MQTTYLANFVVKNSAPRSTYAKYGSLAVLVSSLNFIQICHLRDKGL